MSVNVHQVGLATIIIFIWHNHTEKYVPNCDVSFANGELHQAYGHVTLTMSALPKYGHRSLEGYRLPHLCSYSSPPCICRLIPWVALFSDDFLCLRSWHRTNDMILFCHVIRYGWLVGFCCQIFPICPCQCSVADGFHFLSVLLLSLSITPACFSDVRTAAVMARNLVDTLTCLADCTFILGMD